jgi:excisionase family DNA binding protein
MNQPLLMAEEVSQLLRIPTEHVYRLARRGEITSVRLGRYVRFTSEAVSQYVEANLKAGQL